MKNNIAIKVDHIDKTFKLPHEKNNSLKSSIVNFYKHKKGYEKQQALKDISFEINKGEFFGIVGKNGSGKSTLLKILAGIYQPNHGKIKINGKLVPFIELGVGFSPELSGRDNIFLNGSLLGFSRNEMKAMYDDIVAFAELERFMDQKLKNYSSGMQVRLAFSIAIRTQSDILLLDEVLAVGDEAFQRKSEDFFNRIKKDKNKTVVLVSHSMESIKKYCTQAILVDNGKIIKRGNPEDVANAYTEKNFDSKGINVNKNKIKIHIIPLTKSIVTSKDTFSFKIDYKYPKTKLKVYLAYNIIDLKRGGIPYDSGLFVVRPDDNNVYNLPLTLFNNGDYRVNASIRVGTKDNVIAFTDENSGHVFLIRNKYVKKGLNNDYGLLQRLQ